MEEWRNGFVNAISSHKLECAVEIKAIIQHGHTRENVVMDGMLEGTEGRAGDGAGRCQLGMATGQSNHIAGNLVWGASPVILTVTGVFLSTSQRGTRQKIL